MIAVRTARAEDAAAIARLATQLGYPSTVEQAAERLASLADTDAARVLLAESGGRSAGWLHVAEIRTLESEPYAEIVGLVVDASERSSGIGAVLVQAAIAWAAERGLAEIRVRSNIVRELAHRFYERQGFEVTKTQKVFRRAVPRS
jgi:GNAT superfamily N-acetyltransferase